MKPLNPVREQKYKDDVRTLCHDAFIEINHMKQMTPKARTDTGYHADANDETLRIVDRTIKQVDKLSEQLLKSYR